jgi:hypothetical protein
MADSDLEHCFVSKKALSELGHSFLSKQHGCEQIVHTWPVLLVRGGGGGDGVYVSVSASS